MKTKSNTRNSCYCLVLVSIILLIGCTRVVIVDRNITINRTINRTIYVNNTIYINDTIPCNVTGPEIESIVYDRQYVLGLIRQLKHYEKQQGLYFNDSECNWELNKSNNELKDCEEELCDWNSTWC